LPQPKSSVRGAKGNELWRADRRAAQGEEPDPGEYEVSIVKYRRKGLVEAIQLTQSNLKDVETFLAGEVLPGLYKPRKDFSINWGNSEVKLKIADDNNKTFTVIAEPGDWIVKHWPGHFWKHSAAEFEEHYEAVNDIQAHERP
jgi:hypothetical protein